MVICLPSTSTMSRRTVEKFLLAVCLSMVRGYPSEPHSVNLIISNVLTVYERHAGAESRLEKERYLINNTLNLGCSQDLWNQSASNTNGTLSWMVSTNGNFAFEYGLLDFRVKLPGGAATEVDVGLSSAMCAQPICSKFQRMSTGVTFYGKNLSWQNIYMLFPDPHSTNQLYVDNNQFNVEKPQLDLDGFQLIQLLWSEKFLAWKINDNVVNFTNQLAFPVGDQVLDIIVSCADETVLQPNQEAVFLSSKMDYRQLPGQEKWEGNAQTRIPPPRTLNDYWSDQERVVSLSSYTDDFAIYFERMQNIPTAGDGIYAKGDRWIFLYVQDAWAYFCRQYGPMHQRGESVLYVVFREGTPQRCYTSLQRESTYGRRSILVCDSNDTTAWSWDKRNIRAKLDIGLALSYFVVGSSGGIYGKQNLPSVGTALQDIIAYDLFLTLNQTTQAQQVVNNNSQLSFASPCDGSCWLRDWCLPLYDAYGAANVLSRYFKILTQNFPSDTDDNGIRRYKRNMTNLGEYVHFWSGAANMSLRNLTRNAFGWSAQDEKDLRRAQKAFPKIHYSQQMGSEFGASVLDDDLENAASAMATSTKLLTAILVSAFLVVALVAAVLYLYHRRTVRRKELLKKFTGAKDYGFLVGRELRRFVISQSQLQRSLIILGKGEFGTVYAAVAFGLPGMEDSVPVAAKVLNTRLAEDDKILKALFEQEVRTMIKAGQHRNLVNLLGIVGGDYPTLLLELCELGSLLSCLEYVRSSPNVYVNELDEDGNIAGPVPLERSCPKASLNLAPSALNESAYCARESLLGTLTTSDLVDFAYQTCRGLEYLSSKNIVHRDVAARNVLLTKTRIAKISDFGMARLYEESYVHSKGKQTAPMPVRWMAPETLSTLSFNESTDVWSYGVLAWEIFSLGMLPYSNMSIAGRITEFEGWLKDGHRLEQPRFCPTAM
ncbi:hypothetical protein RvY_18527 [Ramazzottius varieornatus]|uniref:Protein kinase domain-containing protein n=1 Tax=Ramazzottius varieornatus TaxID=947166 RepID=A0A1D1W7M0_RAMVA|nr:hypothetical protein RvY_18527 [Ramazzottius varieornatus]